MASFYGAEVFDRQRRFSELITSVVLDFETVVGMELIDPRVDTTPSQHVPIGNTLVFAGC